MIVYPLNAFRFPLMNDHLFMYCIYWIEKIVYVPTNTPKRVKPTYQLHDQCTDTSKSNMSFTSIS